MAFILLKVAVGSLVGALMGVTGLGRAFCSYPF